MNYYISSPETSSAGSYYESSIPYGSRPQSTSPTMLQSFPELAKLRQEASRGFDAEDDQEFCPALVSHAPAPMLSSAMAAAISASGAAGSSAAFQMSPPHFSATTTANSSQQDDPEVPTVSVRARKALEIIDPATGLPISRR